MDAEKQSVDSVNKTQYPSAPTGHSSLKYLRAVQQIFATVAISFIACAIDRNILVPGISAEEKALLASVNPTPLISLSPHHNKFM